MQTEIKDKIEQALDTVRPFLKMDGGNVELLNIDDNNVVTLKLLGACGSCPMSIMTLKAGVEQALKRSIPEINSVEAINITDMDDPNAVLPERLRG